MKHYFSQSASQTCPIEFEAASTEHRTLSWPFMSRREQQNILNSTGERDGSRPSECCAKLFEFASTANKRDE